MFCISRGWVEKCFRQHYFSLLACTPVTQKLLTKLEILMKFYKNSTAIYIENAKYLHSLVRNMDELKV